MLTSSDTTHEKARALELNIALYIVKPFRRLELLEGILIALGKKGKIAEQIQPVGKMKGMTLHPMRILLAEDIEPNRDLLKQYLKDSPITIDIAENGRIAVEKFISHTYDVVLMDIEMPEMDGLSATQAIRKWEQENRRPKTPVTALTAHAFDEHRKKCFEAGCTGYLTKPIKKRVLIERLLQYGGAGAMDQDNTRTCAETSPEPRPEIIDDGELSTQDCIVCIDNELKELRLLRWKNKTAKPSEGSVTA
ncbi:MAG: response regulator [Desulfosalsimonadaceae bacterium]